MSGYRPSYFYAVVRQISGKLQRNDVMRLTNSDNVAEKIKGLSYVYLFPTLKDAKGAADSWNRQAVRNGSYLFYRGQEA